MTEAILKNN